MVDFRKQLKIEKLKEKLKFSYDLPFFTGVMGYGFIVYMEDENTLFDFLYLKHNVLNHRVTFDDKPIKKEWYFVTIDKSSNYNYAFITSADEILKEVNQAKILLEEKINE